MTAVGEKHKKNSSYMAVLMSVDDIYTDTLKREVTLLIISCKEYRGQFE